MKSWFMGNFLNKSTKCIESKNRCHFQKAWKTFSLQAWAKGYNAKILCKCYASAMQNHASALQVPCKCFACALQVLCKCYARAMQVPCKYHASAMQILCKCLQALCICYKSCQASAMQVLCKCYASAMQVLCKCYARAMQELASAIMLFHCFFRITRDKTKQNKKSEL